MRQLTLFVLFLAVLCPAALAAEPPKAAKRSIMDEEVFPQVKDKPFTEFMRALRDAVPGLATPTERPFAGITPYAPERTTISLITRTPKPLPQVLRLKRKEFEKKVQEYAALLEKEGSASWMVKDGDILYSLEPKKPMPAKDLLEVAASITNLVLLVDGDGVKLTRYTDLPLDVDAVAADLGWPKPEAPKDIAPLIREALRAESGRKAAPPEAKDPTVLLRASLVALKAHTEKDAIRAWLLCVMADRLRANTFKGLSPRTQGAIVAAAREVLGIVDSPAAKKGREELDALLKDYAVNERFDGLLFAAGTLSEDYAEAIRMAGEAARMHADSEAACDAYYDTYYFILSGARHTGKVRYPELVEKAAKEELARRAKGSETVVAAYENWLRKGKKADPCPVCGVLKEQHGECSPMAFLAAAHYRLAQAYSGTGRFAEALPHFEKAMKFAPVTGGCSDRVVLNGEDPHKVLDTGSIEKTRAAWMDTMAAAGKADEAVTEVRNQIAEYEGNNVGALREPLFAMLRKHKREDLIAQVLRDELDRKPDDRDMFDQLVGVLRRQGDLPGAIAVCEKAVKTRPDNKWYASVLEQLRKENQKAGGKPGAPEKF